MDKIKLIRKFVRDVPDFPKPGVLFKDITPLLGNKEAFGESIKLFTDHHRNDPITHIVGIDARGFILAGAVAFELGVGFVPVRKNGRLPYKTHSIEYGYEYSTNTLQIHQDALQPGDKVIILDDLLATGGTARAAAELVTKLGVTVLGLSFLIELSDLKGANKLTDYKLYSAIKY